MRSVIKQTGATTPMQVFRNAGALAAGIVVGILVTTSADAAETSSYTCQFSAGAARSYDKGKFKPEKASTVAFAIRQVDADKQTASIARGDAQGTLRVVRAVNALHFLEVVGEGYLNVTTVYDRDAKATRHPAVHSRHFAVLGQPIVAQYHGFCTPG